MGVHSQCGIMNCNARRPALKTFFLMKMCLKFVRSNVFLEGWEVREERHEPLTVANFFCFFSFCEKRKEEL